MSNLINGTPRTSNANQPSTDPVGSSPAPQQNDAPLLRDANALALGGDLGATIAALIVKTAYAQKASQRDLRKVAEAAEKQADDHEIAALNSKADDMQNAGLYRGLGQIAGGAATAGSALGNGGGAKGIQALGETTQGAFSIVASNFDKDVVQDDANAKVAGEAATQAKAAIQDTRDQTEDASKLLDKALEFYKEYTSTKDQTTAIASRRA